MTVSLKLNETKRRMVYVSLKRTETDTVYIQHCPGLGGYKCTTYEEILIVRGDADDIDKRHLELIGFVG